MGNSIDTQKRTIYFGTINQMEENQVKEVIEAHKTGTIPREIPQVKRGLAAEAENMSFCSNKIVSSKYTFWTFLPKVWWEQFRRVLNFYYFLVIGLLVVLYFLGLDVPIDGAISNAIPFLFVLTITSIKEAYEDCLRHKQDILVNDRMVTIVEKGQNKVIQSKDVIVGNIVRVQRQEHVPADLLVIGSSDAIGRFQISTANLNGETHIKMQYCPSGLPNLNTSEDISSFSGLIECERPSADLRAFNAYLIVPTAKLPVQPLDDDEEEPDALGPRVKSQFTCIPCSMENMALRGTTLKNTAIIWGVVLYTGQETRLAMNSRTARNKFATVERSANFILLFLIFVVLMLVAGCTVIYLFVAHLLQHVDTLASSQTKAWYLWPEDKHPEPAFHIIQVVANFLVLFNYMIPINLYVMLELQQMIVSQFFAWDLELKCPETEEPALSNTSDINEELGQIQHLFTDKTGTLTKNVLQLRHLTINGTRYDLKEGNTLWSIDESTGEEAKVEVRSNDYMVKFLRVIALCHTVQLVPIRQMPHLVGDNINQAKVTTKMKETSSLEEVNKYIARRSSMEEFLGEHEYEASSQDEKALLETCCKLGVTFLGEHEKILTLDVFGEREYFKRHFLLEYESDRKCMSVIVEDTNGEIWLLVKGADDRVLAKSTTGPIKTTERHIQDFARMGMRTMAVAKKQLSRRGLLSFSRQLRVARRLEGFEERIEKIQELYAKVESNVHTVGGTGVEDHLQEHVAETLEILGDAGIRIWILTGDQVGTAVNVAYACDFIKWDTKVLYATDSFSPEAVGTLWRNLEPQILPGITPIFIVDGATLEMGLKVCREVVERLLFELPRLICCRMTPMQKQMVVKMIKSSPGSPITAAVGDGANDVAMLNEAHVGIGIFGREGRQAARSADFSVARFHLLRRAILVHGHWYYVRLANMTSYCFYKSLVLTIPQVIFCFYSGFSGQSLYSAFYYAMYNILFTALPVFVYGLLDQPYKAELLMEYPYIYKEISGNQLLGPCRIFLVILTAVVHSGLIYYVPWVACQVYLDPQICDLSTFGTIVFCCIFAVVSFKLFVFTRFISCCNFMAQLVTYLIFAAGLIIFTEVDLTSINPFFKTKFRGVYLTLVGESEFWLLQTLVMFACVVPDFIVRTFSSFCRMFAEAEQESEFYTPIRYRPPVTAAAEGDLDGDQKQIQNVEVTEVAEADAESDDDGADGDDANKNSY